MNQKVKYLNELILQEWLLKMGRLIRVVLLLLLLPGGRNDLRLPFRQQRLLIGVVLDDRPALVRHELTLVRVCGRLRLAGVMVGILKK